MSHYVYHNTKLIQSKCKFEYQIFGISEQSALKIAARDRDGASRSICYLFLRPIKEKLNRSFTLNARIFSSSTTKQEGKTILESEIMPNFFGQSDTKLLGKWENVLGKWHKLLGKWLKLLGKWSNFVGEVTQKSLGRCPKYKVQHTHQRWPGGVSNSRKGFMVASNALPAFPYKEEAVFPTCEIIITIITSATQIGFVLNLFINWSPSYLLYRYMMTVKTQWRCWHKVLPWLRCLSVSDVNSRRKEISRW